MTKPNLWGGRFSTEAADELRRFNDSFAFDHEMLGHDLAGSQAWANALARAGAISGDEADSLVKALETLAAEEGPLPLDEYEDVHSYVEARLREDLGPKLAGKLHTGRSRNDQVATDFRLYVRAAMHEAIEVILPLARTLATRAQKESGTPMPGYTHLKQAEPITFGHWCLAYVEMLLRDVNRLNAALDRSDESPLGAGALSGSPVSIDRGLLATELGFSRPTANSIDSVSDRDFAADYLFAGAMLLSHLSRLAEDLIFFTSDEVGFAELPDAMATGSSRMPQKKNPDVLELVRGHAGRAIGELVSLLALLKGLPLAYDKDLQLDKEPVFRTRKTLALALPALEKLLDGLALDTPRMREAASSDLLLATGVADSIAKRGIPFRQAHDLVSERIAEAIAAKSTLAELGPTAMITSADLDALDIDRALAARSAIGGTAPSMVEEAAVAALRRIKTISGEYEL
jgi:argininosuccinate lyase